MASMCADNGHEDSQSGVHLSTGGAVLVAAPDNPLGKYNNERFTIYESMAAELPKQGPVFLGGGETSQSLKLTDIFSLKEGKVVPVHKEADPPVRATVLHLDPNMARQISQTVKAVLAPHFLDSGVWYQDPGIYHFSMYHASHHQNPVPATSEEVEAEAAAVKKVAEQSCSLEIELERVVLTPTGVLLGCWQVMKGSEPLLLRNELKKALPRSPAKQLYNPAIFYTSFARLLSAPVTPSKNETVKEALETFKELVSELNQRLCCKATIKELWYVEELDVLALALNGRTRIHKFPLECHPLTLVDLQSHSNEHIN